MTYFNTTRVRGQQLVDYECRTNCQEDAIEDFFRANIGVMVAPHEVQGIIPSLERAPLTSIRRAFTNLEHAGVIEKTDVQIEGTMGRPVYLWRKPK